MESGIWGDEGKKETQHGPFSELWLAVMVAEKKGTDLLQLHCGKDILDSCGQVGLRVRQGIRAAESQSKTGTGIEWIATSEEAKEEGATPALLITITWVLTIGIWLIQCHQPRKFFRLQGAQLSGSRKRRRMPLYRKGKDGQTELDFQSSRERKVPPRFFLQVWTFHFSDINQSNPAKEILIFFDGMVKGFQSRLILRPLTRRSNPVFKRVSWFTCWISPESLYFHGEGLNTIIGSSPLLHSSWYVWFSGISLIFKVVFSWISVWLFVLSYSYYSFKGCELMYLGFALMYGSLPWAIFPSD